MERSTGSTNTQRKTIDQLNDKEDKAEVDELNADYNNSCDHTRVCGSPKASLLTHPTQAVTAAPGARSVTAGSYPHDRTDSGPSFQKDPDLGGGKVVGVTETVATIEGSSSVEDESILLIGGQQLSGSTFVSAWRSWMAVCAVLRLSGRRYI
jgi:hypothetical protein